MTSAKDVVDRALQAWHARDADAFAECYTADAAIAGPGGREARGPDGARMFLNFWTDAFPDNALTVDRAHIAGSVVVHEGTLTGTHTGNLPAADGRVLQATGRSISCRYVEIFAVEDDLIVSDRVYVDRLDMLQQLGSIPQPAEAA
jgi:hypothetical protein